MLRLTSALAFALVLVSSPPALATIAKPVSGTALDVFLGETIEVLIKNAAGCTFDHTTSSSNAGVVNIINASGSNETSVKVGFTGAKVGTTNVGISTTGSCPNLTHNYALTVSADYGAIQKEFGAQVKSSLKDYKIDTKLAFTNYRTTLAGLGVDYRDGAITDVELFQGFHDAGTTLRQQYWGAGLSAYADVINFGSGQLFDASAQFGEAPAGMFAFGWGAFDDFQDFVCGDFAKFHTTYGKESHKAIKGYARDGAPMLGQLVTLPPIVSGGPLYPEQLGAIPMLAPLTGPLTITSLPATNMAGDDGRIAVSGIGDSAQTGNLDVTLSFYQNSTKKSSWTLSPGITSGEWDTEFTGLSEGTYIMTVGYGGDLGKIELPIQVQWNF
ncbi:MAG TPA: hypothetical protein VEC56_11720 [Candidatus Krumholzibacteria bacterium]|nr:hypothetical protein [Candidatus Krumholzibacteria bacterium]